MSKAANINIHWHPEPVMLMSAQVISKYTSVPDFSWRPSLHPFRFLMRWSTIDITPTGYFFGFQESPEEGVQGGRMFHTLRYLGLSIYNLFRYRSNAFACCAGCGLLPVPLGKRLCVSCLCNFPVDAVLTGAWEASSARAAQGSLRAAMPWLRHVFLPSALGDVTERSERTLLLPKGVQDASLHRLEELSEYFLVVPPNTAEALAGKLLREDFFTPNGIPLLFAGQGGNADTPNFLSGIAGRTKTLNALFFDVREACPPDKDDDGYAFMRWAYAKQHGILAPALTGA